MLYYWNRVKYSCWLHFLIYNEAALLLTMSVWLSVHLCTVLYERAICLAAKSNGYPFLMSILTRYTSKKNLLISRLMTMNSNSHFRRRINHMYKFRCIILTTIWTYMLTNRSCFLASTQLCLFLTLLANYKDPTQNRDAHLEIQI